MSFFSLEFWYEFHVWDPSGKYGSLRFFVRRSPSFLVYLTTADIDLDWRLNTLWFSVGERRALVLY